MSGQVFHAPFFDTMPHFELYAVWERTKNLAEEKYPGVKTYRQLDALLGDEEVELVIVNTPNFTHYEFTKMALDCGKHVVVEKPFTVTVEEGEFLIHLAKEKNKLLSVYQNRRYDSDFKTIRKIITEGKLGKIVEAEFHFDRYKLELSPKVHKETGGPGTGVLYDLGSHLIDQALQLFGMPASVFADLQVLRPGSNVDDFFELILYYSDLRVRLHSSYLVREPLPAYQIHGTLGSFIKAKTDVQENALQSGAKPGGKNWGKEPEAEKGWLHVQQGTTSTKEHVISMQGNYGDYYEDIFNSIRFGKPLPVTAEEGLNVVRIIRAAMKSSAERKVIDL